MKKICKFHTSSILCSIINNNSSSSTITITQDIVEAPYSNLSREAQEQLNKRIILIRQTEENPVQGQNIRKNSELETNTLTLNIRESGSQSGLNSPISTESPISTPDESSSLFNIIRKVNSHLQQESIINPTRWDNVRFSQIFAPFQSNPAITAQELLSQLRSVDSRLPQFLTTLVQSNTTTLARILPANLLGRTSSSNTIASTSSSNPIASTSSSNPIANTSSSNSIASTSGSVNEVLDPRPFGEYGQMTLNQLATRIQNSNLNTIINSLNVDVHVLAGASLAVSYGFGLRTFLRLVQNRPKPSGLNAERILREHKFRRTDLRIFMFMGAPIILWGVNLSGLTYKDVVTVNFPLGSFSGNPPGDGSNFVNQAVLFFASFNKFRNNLPNWLKFRQKLPNWFKLIILLIIISLILNKLWGFNVILLLFTQKFWSIYFFVGISIALMYYILFFYVLHIFITKKVKLKTLNFLPQILKPWLEDIYIISTHKKKAINQIKKERSVFLIFYAVMFIVLILLI